jgi:4-amino-4-deoxy-L-arabinose transferase-like glycosyltransferase
MGTKGNRLSKLTGPLAVLLLAAFLRLFRLASVPFGWHPDEATKALLARGVLAGEYFPACFSAFTGRGAWFVYLEALLFFFLGEGIFTGRLLSAFVGILTAALTYATGRDLFKRRVGLLAAALLAVSLWHVIASRNGYRAVIQPLIQLPVILLLFRGLRQTRIEKADGSRGRFYLRSSTFNFIMAGVFLGMTQYTYTAVRLFPFLVAIIVVLAWIFDRPRVNGNLGNLALMGLVAFLLFLPLGYYFWQNPLDFYGRASQISVFSPEWAEGDAGARLMQSVRETARMWTVWGDINFRFNISGRPVFTPLEGLLFLSGIVLTLWRAMRHDGLQRVAYLSLLIWLGVMLLPMVLSAESLPYYQRAIGVLPAIYVLPAIALDAAISWYDKRTNWRYRRVGTAVLILFVVWLAFQAFQDYFSAWHETVRNDDDRRVAMVYVADYLKENDPNGELYLSTQYMQHPTLALLAPERYDGIHWFDARQSLPLPPEQNEAIYVLLAENQPQPWLLAHAADLQKVHTGLDRFNRPVFEVYHWRGGGYPQPEDSAPAVWSWETSFEAGDIQGLRHAIELPVAFGDVIQFLGHDRNATELTPADTLELILHWQLSSKPQRQYTIFAHLLDKDGRVVTGFDANEYPTSFWRKEGGERLMSYMRLPLGADLEPGEYQLEIGVYNQPTGERLPIMERGEMVADRLLLAPISVVGE